MRRRQRGHQHALEAERLDLLQFVLGRLGIPVVEQGQSVQLARLLGAEFGQHLVVGVHAGLDVVEVLVADHAEHALGEEDLLFDALARDLLDADGGVPHAGAALDHFAGHGRVVGRLTIDLHVEAALVEDAARGAVAVLGRHAVDELAGLEPVAVG